MKRILLCGILALAAGTMAFAQWPDGFSVSGQVKTGLRADFFGGEYENTISDSRDRALFSFWHDDAGNRTQLDMQYNQENFGFRLIPRWSWQATGAMNNPGTSFDVDAKAQIPVAYGWFELMNGMVRVTAGLIDDSRWVSPTPEDIHFSNGTGLRVEVMPVEGLNVGWIIGRGDTVKNNILTSSTDGIDYRMRDLFAGSSFGAKYTSAMFTVAGGLELRGDQRDRPTYGTGFDTASNTGTVTSGAFNGATIGRDEVAIAAYAGVEVKPIDGLTVQVGANARNLDWVDRYGWMHLNEKVAYDLGGITPRLTAHQKFDLSKTNATKFVDPDLKNQKQTPVWMEFVPGVDFSIADGLNGYVEVPVKMFDKTFGITVKPGISYAFGPGLGIDCYYRFVLTDNGYDNGPDAYLRNTVQISFNWSF